MKIHVLSDLHLETESFAPEPNPAAELLVLGGDIDSRRVAPGDLARFAKVDLFGIDRFGGWKEAQATHFADGGVFDQIYKPTN